jgi:hypothetical protein
MKYIKAYEMFDFNQTLPTTSQDVLTSYYHCDGCNALYKSVNSTEDDCKFCNSRELEELSEDEYYDTIGERLDDDEKEDLEEVRQKEKNKFVDLYNLRNKDVN